MTAARTHSAESRAEVARHPWYHTIDLGGGLSTPGFWDLRPAVARIPWPDLRGLRCLDVGTFDGFWAFEMERRGAGEVVALDLVEVSLQDWPFDLAGDAARLAAGGERRGDGFRLAQRLLGSTVRYVDGSVYDLSRAEVGEFDLVYVGYLLEHLRDPQRALAAIRRVCRGWVIVHDLVRLWLSVLHPRRALADVVPSPRHLQWQLFNRKGLERMVEMAGFRVDAVSGFVVDRPGPTAPRGRDVPLPQRARYILGLTGRSFAVRGRVRPVTAPADRSGPR